MPNSSLLQTFYTKDVLFKMLLTKLRTHLHRSWKPQSFDASFNGSLGSTLFCFLLKLTAFLQKRCCWILYPWTNLNSLSWKPTGSLSITNKIKTFEDSSLCTGGHRPSSLALTRHCAAFATTVESFASWRVTVSQKWSICQRYLYFIVVV